MSEQPDSFPEVARLLSLKRHEVPPPAYFNGFSAKVIARIEAESLAASRPWWSALLAPMSWQRGLAGANTLLVVGIGITGVAAYQSLQSSPEEENTTWAALKLPASSAIAGERSADMPTSSTFAADDGFHAANSVVHTLSRPNLRSAYPLGIAPVSLSTTGSEGSAESFAPASLFNTPTAQSLHGSQPRFVFPSE